MATFDYGHNGAEVVQDHSDYANLSQTGAAVVVGGGRLLGIRGNGSGSATAAHLPTVTLYDGSSSDGAVLMAGVELSIGASIAFPSVRVRTGLYVGIGSGTGALVTVFYLKDLTP